MKAVRVRDKYNEALSQTLFANDALSNASAEQTEERDWFFTYLTEAVNGTDAADVFFDAMPVEVQDLTVEWLIENESRLDNLEPLDDPFSTDEDGNPILESANQLQSTVLRELGRDLDEEAECALFDKQVAQIQGDRFGVSTVFLAIALVVGGIAALLKGKSAQIIVLVTSILSLALGSLVLAFAYFDQDGAEQAAAQAATQAAATEFGDDDVGQFLLSNCSESL